jgi:signal transduction histidine kinase
MAPFRRALYYPTIDFPSERWLKTAVLYWDEIFTIVPASVKDPYESPTARELAECKVLKPWPVDSDMRCVERAAERLLQEVQTPEAAMLCNEELGHGSFEIYTEKIAAHLAGAETVAGILEGPLGRMFATNRGGTVHVPRPFGKLYLTLLAAEIAADSDFGLLTDVPFADHLCTNSRLENRFAIPNPPPDVRPKEPAIENRMARGTFPILAQGLLAHVSLPWIFVSDETPVRSLVQYRNEHREELESFRNAMAELTEGFGDARSLEALQERVCATYHSRVERAVKDLRDGLQSITRNQTVNGLLKLSSLSVGAGAVLPAIGFQPISALLALGGIVITGAAILYNQARREALARSPFSYVLSTERFLGRQLEEQAVGGRRWLVMNSLRHDATIRLDLANQRIQEASTASDDYDIRRNLDGVFDQIRSAEAAVRELGTLATEPPSGEPRMEVVLGPELVKIIHDVIDLSVAAYKREGVRIDMRDLLGLETVSVAIDRRSFELALKEIVRNALRYSIRNTEICTKGTLLGNVVRITVENLACKMDFQRAISEHPRSRDNPPDIAHGSGDGIMLVRKITESMGGRLDIDSIDHQEHMLVRAHLTIPVHQARGQHRT